MDRLQVWMWILLALTTTQASTSWAINTCSHTLAFGGLCPMPQFVGGSLPDADVSIDLLSQLSARGGDTHSSCDFFKDKDEISSIGGIHVSNEPFNFYRASPCNHVVKLMLSERWHGGGSQSDVCTKELGMKIHENSYLWHNFTLKPHQVSFVDLITNYGESPSDVQCTRSPRFVLILFLTSRNSKCSLLVQQYHIDDEGKGCESVSYPPSYRFCGAYPCSESNNILQGLKLISRPIRRMRPSHYPSSGEEESQSGNSNNINMKRRDNYETTPSTTTTTTDKGDVGIPELEIDWDEWIVRLLFPTFGIAFIFLVFYILREKYAEEICGRVRGNSQYHGSIMSMEKQGLQL